MGPVNYQHPRVEFEKLVAVVKQMSIRHIHTKVEFLIGNSGLGTARGKLCGSNHRLTNARHPDNAASGQSTNGNPDGAMGYQR